MRDHDVRTPEMDTFVSLAHTVFNAGLVLSWEINQDDHRSFLSADEWSLYLVERGFKDSGHRLLQANDPTDNTLMAFLKTDSGGGG